MMQQQINHRKRTNIFNSLTHRIPML